jgi:hypothetical protein
MIMGPSFREAWKDGPRALACMVGSLHAWVADKDGTFRGGYYADVGSVGHGEGCGYVTTAHEARYHDDSTGFRCCADEARR